MNLLRKVLARGRMKSARMRLAGEPSPRNYAALAHEYVVQASFSEVVRICDEGLLVFPGSAELAALRQRARHFILEERLVEIRRELAEAPRPALWSEMCEALLASGELDRATEAATNWSLAGGGAEARLALTRMRSERYFADRGREEGIGVHDLLREVCTAMPNDARAWQLALGFFTSIGAWKDARRAAAHLLQLAPGDPAVEARFRSVDSMADRAPSVERALMEVERTGRFADESDAQAERPAGADVRPILRRIAEQPDVEAAIYVRGSTALVQGFRGATADRTARAVKQILVSGRAASRRLSMGQTTHIQLEGEFGTFVLALGDVDAGVLWTKGPVAARLALEIAGLAGLDASAQEDAA